MEEHPPISAETLRETVKDLTKKAKFGEACDRLRGWTERAEVLNLYPLLVHAHLFGGGYEAQVASTLSRYGGRRR